MLVCYLDDSGKDAKNPITTLAGYVAREDQWKAFEAEVEPWFSEFGVKILHAKDLHHTDGEFEGWTVLRKQAFIARICQVMSRHLPLGLSTSAVKEAYEANRVRPDGQRIRASAYSFCFNLAIDFIFRDVRVGKDANTDGVAFFLETGHENNPDAERSFHAVRKEHGLENLMHSICFIPKERCRAIQIADLLAFYSRRRGVAIFNARSAGGEITPDPIMNLVSASLPHRAFVADRFYPREELPF